MTAKRGGLPEFVKVGHLTYKIAEMTRKDAERADIYGDIVHSDASIRVKEGMAPGATAETLLHEIMHAVFDEWEIKMPIAEEERIVGAMARGMATVMRDNPAVMAWMMKTLRA